MKIYLIKMIKSALMILFSLFFGFLAGSGLSAYLYFASKMPELDAAIDYQPNVISRVYDREGVLIGEFALQKRIPVPLTQMSDHVKNAIIAVEDAHFFSHRGLDIIGISRAAWKNLLAGEIIQGGSTITQQLAKTLFLTHERTLKRKLQEALVALELEKKLPKDRILELYLNQVYFGSGAYGIEAASRTYFSKSSADLSLAEAAMLAGLPKAPSRFSPFNNIDLAINRRNIVIQRMQDSNIISAQEAEKIINSSIKLNRGGELVRKAPYFVEIIRRELESEFGRKLYTDGYIINSTLNYRFQCFAEEAVRAGLHEVTKRRKWRGPVDNLKVPVSPPNIGVPVGAEILSVEKDSLTLKCGGIEKTIPFKTIWIKNRYLRQLKSKDRVWFIVKSYKSEEKTEIDECEITQEPEVEAALVSMDPRNGEILAWVGGYDFNRSQFDRVTQAKRQPGSGFKPFLYAAALDGPYTASHIVYDTPIVIEKTWEKEEIKDAIPDKEILENDEDEKEYWKPHNYSEEFYGATTLRTGLEKSRNIISIHVLEEIGTRNVIRLARRMGVKSQLTNTLSLALGASEVSLLEMVQAYGGFANLGVVADPLKISNILNRSHQIQKEFYPSLRRAIRPETAYLISNLLQGVIQRGTGIKARRLNRPMGGKTGTTNSYYDTWFNGFTPQMVTIVWVGMDLLEPISQHATGASTALPIWIDYMEDAIKDYEPTDFSVPDNIVFEKICKDTGLLATEKCPNTLIEAYREGTEPLQFCDKHQLIKREYRQGVNLDWDADLIFNDQLSGEKPDEELDEIIGDTDEASELSLDQFESSDESSSPRSSNTM